MLRSSYSLNFSLARVLSVFSTEFKVWEPNYSLVKLGKFLWTMEYAISISISPIVKPRSSPTSIIHLRVHSHYIQFSDSLTTENWTSPC